MESKPRQIERDQAIDCIKVLAMVGVLALHVYYGVERREAWMEPYWMGLWSVAIPCFFAASGYLQFGRETGWEYVRRKLAGILRFMGAVMLIYLVFQPGSWRNFYRFLAQSGDFWHFWYFAALMLVYACTPILKRVFAANRENILLIALGLACTAAFLLNCTCDFEHRYAVQTLRIWNWLFYYCAGMYISKRRERILPRVRGWHAAVAMAVCVAFIAVWSPVHGSEYYFGSLPCMAYTLTLFCYVAGRNVKSRLVAELAPTFLICYTLHPFLLVLYRQYIHFEIPNPSLNMVVHFALMAAFTLGFCRLAIRAPFVRQLFKI